MIVSAVLAATFSFGLLWLPARFCQFVSLSIFISVGLSMILWSVVGDNGVTGDLQPVVQTAITNGNQNPDTLFNIDLHGYRCRRYSKFYACYLESSQNCIVTRVTQGVIQSFKIPNQAEKELNSIASICRGKNTLYQI